MMHLSTTANFAIVLCNKYIMQHQLSSMAQGSTAQGAEHEGMACPYFEDEDVSTLKKMRIVPWRQKQNG